MDPVAAIEAAIRRAVISAALSLGCPPTFAGSYTDRVLGDVVGYARIAGVALEPDEAASLITYLGSPDFRHLVPQIAILCSPASNLERVPAALRDQLLHGLRHAMGIPNGRLSRIVDGLIVALIDLDVRAVFDPAPMSAIIPALSHATATANARLLAEAPDLGAFREVGDRMRARVAALHAEIRLPHTGQNRSVRWDALYVSPNLDADRDGDPQPDVGDLARPARHTVILGDPGAGKSTLAAKLAYDVATSDDEERANLVPFLVVLRDLSRALEHGERSLADHLISVCREPYHVGISPDALEYLLLNGRALVILDGLDELTDVALRGRVVRLIEGFVAAYPSVPVVVTSRSIGYLDAPLPSSVFTACGIASFTTEQVESYATRWFALDDGNPPYARSGLAAAFLDESTSIDDLRSNPLLLSLLCAMYAAEHFIPGNRAQVYERCALMIFERWDRMRQVGTLRQFRGEVRTAVQRLAWQLLIGAGPTELPRSSVVRLLIEHLVARGYDEDEAAPMADEFLDFCAGRAWVLAELGVVGAEPVYGFAHRTFLEFFAAEHLVRNHPLPEQVWAVLDGRVGEATWEVVGQLAVQLLERNLERGADRLVSAALNLLTEAEPNRISAMSAFSTRTLQHVALSPPVITRVVNIMVDQMLALPVADRIVPWSEIEKTRLANAVDQPLHESLERSLDSNLRSVRRALADRFAAETAADRDTALLLTEQMDLWRFPGRISPSVASEVYAEVVERSADSFNRWREQLPWHRLRENGDDPAVLVDVFERFGLEPLYLEELIFGRKRSPAWTRPFHVAGPSPATIGRLGQMLMNRAQPWLPWPPNSPHRPDEKIFSPMGVQWQPDGISLATFVLLALPYLEFDTGLCRVPAQQEPPAAPAPGEVTASSTRGRSARKPRVLPAFREPEGREKTSTQSSPKASLTASASKPIISAPQAVMMAVSNAINSGRRTLVVAYDGRFQAGPPLRAFATGCSSRRPVAKVAQSSLANRRVGPSGSVESRTSTLSTRQVTSTHTLLSQLLRRSGVVPGGFNAVPL